MNLWKTLLASGFGETNNPCLSCLVRLSLINGLQNPAAKWRLISAGRGY